MTQNGGQRRGPDFAEDWRDFHTERFQLIDRRGDHHEFFFLAASFDRRDSIRGPRDAMKSIDRVGRHQHDSARTKKRRDLADLGLSWRAVDCPPLHVLPHSAALARARRRMPGSFRRPACARSRPRAPRDHRGAGCARACDRLTLPSRRKNASMRSPRSAAGS